MTISNTDALVRIIEHREIFHDEMLTIMRRIMGGEMSPVMIAAMAIGLRVKKETIGEIAAAAQVMRELATPVPIADRTHLVDIVGTGGDSSHTFNISTASTFVAAAAGARVAKHGGRSVSSTSGSADIIEPLEISLSGLRRPTLLGFSKAECVVDLLLGRIRTVHLSHTPIDDLGRI